MFKPSHDLSALFRSLRPNESNSRESGSGVATQAEQHWPLFKAVEPEKPKTPPLLSVSEREHWVSPETPQSSVPKPALSLHELSDKMSKGLENMSGRDNKSAPRSDAVRRQQHDSLTPGHIAKSSHNGQPVVLTKPQENHTFLAPAASQSPDFSLATKLSKADTFDRPSLKAVTPPSSFENPQKVTGGEELLKSVFTRLERKVQIAPKPAGNLSAFLDRLGKR